MLIQSTNLSNYARNYATNHTSTGYNTKLSVAAVLALLLTLEILRACLIAKHTHDRRTDPGTTVQRAIRVVGRSTWERVE